MNMNLMFIQRIENLRIKSSKCEKDLAFWNKTAPLWNKMTECLQASIIETPTGGESELSVPKAYAEEKARRNLFDLTDDSRPPSLMQNIMMNGSVLLILIIVMMIDDKIWTIVITYFQRRLS